MFIITEVRMSSSSQLVRVIVTALALVLAGRGGRVDAVEPGSEGIAALRHFLTLAPLAEGEAVLGLVGFHGRPTPERWLILTGLPGEGPGEGKALRESVYHQGRVAGGRSISPRSGEDWPTLAIDLGLLRITSERAYEIALARAAEQGGRFETVHYQLRVRGSDREPVWVLNLIGRSQLRTGTLYLSARDGRILRESWKSSLGTPDVSVSAR